MLIFKKTILQFLAISSFFCITSTCGRLTTSPPKNIVTDSKSESTSSSDLLVEAEIVLTSQAHTLAQALTAESLQVSSFDFVIAGCDKTSHGKFNRIYSDIAFTNPSTTSKFFIPANDAGCYLSLSKLVVDKRIGDTTSKISYQIEDGEIGESADDRITKSVMIFALSSGIGGPRQIPFSISEVNWKNLTAPISGAAITYIFSPLVPPGPNAGPTQRIQGTIGSGDVSIPLDIVSLNISSFADLTSIPNREGSYELTFSCSAEIMNISPKHCGDIIGEDSASSISNNFAVCTVRSDFFSENDIIQMGESFCGSFTGKSTADTALASRPRSGEEFPLNAAASAGRLKMTEIKLPLPNNSLLNIDFIETVSTSVWVLIRVETKSGKWKIKYWKVYF